MVKNLDLEYEMCSPMRQKQNQKVLCGPLRINPFNSFIASGPDEIHSKPVMIWPSCFWRMFNF